MDMISSALLPRKDRMQMGIIGVAAMGHSLAINFKNQGYDVVAYDLDQNLLQSMASYGIQTVTSTKDLTETISTKRVIWFTMDEGEPADVILEDLTPYLSLGDIIIEISTIAHTRTLQRSQLLEGVQVNLLDCKIKTAGNGVAEKIMIWGNRFAFNYCEHLFHDLCKTSDVLYCGPIR